MYKFNPNKLKVIYRQEINKKLLETPRKYTLTHSDKTANLFLSTIKLIEFLLSKYRSAMIYLILGLMLGSLYAVFMGPTTLEVPQPAMNLSSFYWIFFIIGGALIIALEKFKYIYRVCSHSLMDRIVPS